MRCRHIWFWSVVIFVLTACGSSPASTSQPEPSTSLASAALQEATPTPSLVASPTPLSSPTASATISPPTATATPQVTASPTNTGDELLDQPVLDNTQSSDSSATLVPSETQSVATATSTAPQDTPPSSPTAQRVVSKQQAEASQPIRLEIPKIELNYSLVSVGLDKNNVPIVPDHDVAWYNLSARPGQGDNVVMWAHVLRFKKAPHIPAPFARVRELSIGDQIFVYTEDGAIHPYRVKEMVYATPDQVAYILPVGKEQLTLVSCIGDKIIVDGSVELTHRLITIAEPDN